MREITILQYAYTTVLLSYSTTVLLYYANTRLHDYTASSMARQLIESGATPRRGHRPTAHPGRPGGMARPALQSAGPGRSVAACGAGQPALPALDKAVLAPSSTRHLSDREPPDQTRALPIKHGHFPIEHGHFPIKYRCSRRYCRRTMRRRARVVTRTFGGRRSARGGASGPRQTPGRSAQRLNRTTRLLDC